jgi:tetratricopeptide (TPR) repeat protein
MDDYREQHQQLLDRFSAAMKKGGADSWFDEDELLTIFDYAGDIGNDYLRTEALLWGARYFPESKALLERRGVLYSDVLGNEAVLSFTNDIADKGTLITNLLKYRADGMTKETAGKTLDEIVADKSRMLDDEEMIQLVNFAFETNNSDWLYENLDNLRKKTTFLPTLLFEVAALSFESGDFERTTPLLEELVGESPYSVEYWDMLTKSYFASDKKKEGFEALEMCLAIDPEFLPALQIKAHTLALEGKIDEIEKIVAINPFDQEIAEALVNAKLFVYAKYKEHHQEIIDDLCNYAELFPQSDVFIDRLLTIAPDRAKPALSAIWNNLISVSTEEEAPRHWKEWVEGLTAECKFLGAMAVLEFFFSMPHPNANSDDIDNMHTTLAILYFIAQKWQQCYDTIVTYQSKDMDTNCMIKVAKVMSLIRLHRIDEAREIARNVMDSDRSFSFGEDIDWTGVCQLTQVGLGIFMSHFLDVTSDDEIDNFDADKFDPLHFWV